MGPQEPTSPGGLDGAEAGEDSGLETSIAAPNTSGIAMSATFQGEQVSLRWAPGNGLCPSPPLPFPCCLFAALLLHMEKCISVGEGRGRALDSEGASAQDPLSDLAPAS